jgi:UPF0042 nucleotide-binding protein
VISYLKSHAVVQEMEDDLTWTLEKWLPRFEENHRAYMTVAIGCTGGQHRSVYLAESLGARFADRFANVLVRHRELGST